MTDEGVLLFTRNIFRQSQDGSVELVGRLYSSTGNEHRLATSSLQVRQQKECVLTNGCCHACASSFCVGVCSDDACKPQQSLFSSARPSTQQAIPRQTIVTEFLSDKAREILRQSGQDLGSSGAEDKLWSSLNASRRMDISSSMDFGHSVHKSQNLNGSNGYGR